MRRQAAREKRLWSEQTTGAESAEIREDHEVDARGLRKLLRRRQYEMRPATDGAWQRAEDVWASVQAPEEAKEQREKREEELRLFQAIPAHEIPNVPGRRKVKQPRGTRASSIPIPLAGQSYRPNEYARQELMEKSATMELKWQRRTDAGEHMLRLGQSERQFKPASIKEEEGEDVSSDKDTSAQASAKSSKARAAVAKKAHKTAPPMSKKQREKLRRKKLQDDLERIDRLARQADQEAVAREIRASERAAHRTELRSKPARHGPLAVHVPAERPLYEDEIPDSLRSLGTEKSSHAQELYTTLRRRALVDPKSGRAARQGQVRIAQRANTKMPWELDGTLQTLEREIMADRRAVKRYETQQKKHRGE